MGRAAFLTAIRSNVLQTTSLSVSEGMLRRSSGRGAALLFGDFGEPGRNRTYNQQIKSLLLCQLSYGPTLGVRSGECEVRHRTRTSLARPFRGLAHADVIRAPFCRTKPTASRDWRARQDSNLRPTDSKSGDLSN